MCSQKSFVEATEKRKQHQIELFLSFLFGYFFSMKILNRIFSHAIVNFPVFFAEHAAYSQQKSETSPLRRSREPEKCRKECQLILILFIRLRSYFSLPARESDREKRFSLTMFFSKLCHRVASDPLKFQNCK